MCFDFVYIFSEIFIVLSRIGRHIIINGQMSSCKVPVILVRFKWSLNFLDIFLKIIQIPNFKKHCNFVVWDFKWLLTLLIILWTENIKYLFFYIFYLIRRNSYALKKGEQFPTNQQKSFMNIKDIIGCFYENLLLDTYRKYFMSFCLCISSITNVALFYTTGQRKKVPFDKICIYSYIT